MFPADPKVGYSDLTMNVTPLNGRVFDVRAQSLVLLLASLAVFPVGARAALGDPAMAGSADSPGAFTLARPGSAAPLAVSDGDWPGVLRAVRDLQGDIGKVSGSQPPISSAGSTRGEQEVFVGTVGRSALIDSLASAGKIDVGAIRGKWESFLIQVVDNPMPGVPRALVIAGSDKRGTIYGAYEVSQQIGVSPWYWWADVPIRHRDSVYFAPVRRVEGEPAVKYRGIFLNDEAPALAGWAKEKFGGFNHQFYATVFELLLRLRGNYLWPAMWDNAFNEDDPENARLADEFGIVMGTSHHEPMLRAQQEWKRHGSGPWNFSDNPDVLTKFWSEGIRRNRNFESITTIGMRGDGDMPMSSESNISLLEHIVEVQRGIIAREVNPDVAKVPQDWALYKEVQDYFEKGMRVPDDVTLLWCDDNWGNLRRLPTAAERLRPGGAGIYYHFDYVGDPRSYKWLNTFSITKVREQMNLANEYRANRIWIVNVGDLKPMEFPIEFFLNFAWKPDRWPSGRLDEFGEDWAAREFGPEHAREIAGLMSSYTKFNSRRKPEHVEPETFSLTNYGEADRVVGDWERIVAQAAALQSQLPPEDRDAFYQLVTHPVVASAIVTELNVAAARNHLYAVQGRASANLWASKARELFARDAALTAYWNEQFAGGRWRHFMDQTHLGYTNWQEPLCNVMPPVSEVQVPEGAKLGVAVDGRTEAWPVNNLIGPPSLPELLDGGPGTTGLEVFNRGAKPASFSITADEPWIHAEPSSGTVDSDMRIAVSVDWGAVPEGRTTATLLVTSPNSKTVKISLPVVRPAAGASGFMECDGYIAMEAPHFDRAVAAHGVGWDVLTGYGSTLGGMTTVPVTSEGQVPGGDSARLEYDIFVSPANSLKIDVTVAPTVNFQPGHGLRFAVSLDDEAPQVDDYKPQVGGSRGPWAVSVMDGVRHCHFSHGPVAAGPHVLKYWMVDPGVVLERIVVDAGGVRASYLGPPESTRSPSSAAPR